MHNGFDRLIHRREILQFVGLGYINESIDQGRFYYQKEINISMCSFSMSSVFFLEMEQLFMYQEEHTWCISHTQCSTTVLILKVEVQYTSLHLTQTSEWFVPIAALVGFLWGAFFLSCCFADKSNGVHISGILFSFYIWISFCVPKNMLLSEVW